MAVKELTPVKGVLNKLTEFAFEAATAVSDGCEFLLPKTTDEYVVVIAHNTSTSAAYNATVKKPVDGSYYAAASDETKEIAAGKFAIFRLESAKWASNKGKIKLVPGNEAVKFAVLY
ncbi:MAG: hypothetical protein ACI4LK_02355 [Lentihominibacter sp.]